MQSLGINYICNQVKKKLLLLKKIKRTQLKKHCSAHAHCYAVILVYKVSSGPPVGRQISSSLLGLRLSQGTPLQTLFHHIRMKVKKQKRHRKAVRFYTACFGFHEPYKILCDGTFIHHLLSNQIPLDGHALSNTLGGSTKLFTTRCVMAELKSLGASYSDSFRAAGSLITARCDHEKRKSAKECIEEVIREDNSEHFFVASQDIDLRKKFQEVAGVPVMYGLRNALFLDPPSQSQRKLANEMEEKRLHVTQSEYEVLVKSGRSNLATETAGDAPDTHEDQVGMEESLSRKYPGRRVSNVMDKARFKRKRAKGPNPLSCKKKQNRGNPSSASSQEGKDGESATRKKKRSGNGIKPGETDS